MSDSDLGGLVHVRSRLSVSLVGIVAVVIGALTAVILDTPAHAKGGEVGGAGTDYYLNDSWSAKANIEFSYGSASDLAYVGDWNGDGVDSLGVRRANVYYLRNALSGGPADSVVAYGRAADVVLVGDWDGDGVDTLAVRRGNVYYIKNALAGGPADRVVVYGRATDVVLVGDWDGDGVDTLAVRRGNVYYIKNALAGGPADRVVVYGRSSDAVVVGDWDGDVSDTLAVRRGNVYYVKNSLAPGAADITLAYGRSTDSVLVGDWNGDASDTLGVRRLAPAPVTFGPGQYRVGTDIPAGTYRSSSTTGECYWERQSGFTGTLGDIIANDYGQPLSIVTLETSDMGFEANNGCGTWRSVEVTYPIVPLTRFGDGVYVVGRHVAPGTYRALAPSGGSCYWERLSGFSGTFDDIIANDYGGSRIVTISDSDVGFLTHGCGEWATD